MQVESGFTPNSKRSRYRTWCSHSALGALAKGHQHTCQSRTRNTMKPEGKPERVCGKSSKMQCQGLRCFTQHRAEDKPCRKANWFDFALACCGYNTAGIMQRRIYERTGSAPSARDTR